MSLKELRILAQQQLGGRASELKTRQELVDALEAHEAKRARRTPKAIQPLSAPLPAPVPATIKPLPPEPVIWTGQAPIPKITIDAPVISDFFTAPPAPEASYGDDRVLTFARDPQTIYAAWDFSAPGFLQGAAQGQVVDARGVAISSFEVGAAQGGAFVGQLPGGQALRVEVRRGPVMLGSSGWLTLEPQLEPVVPASSSV